MIITISRQGGTNGGLIAQLVADRLGYRVYDKELVDEIACRLEVDPTVVNAFDEMALTPVHSLLLEWRSAVNEQIYRRYLREALERIRQTKAAVILGRGANFVLCGPDMLHVRIVAPASLRTAIYYASHEVSEEEAARAVRQQDADRAHFVRSIFNADVADPALYDLTVNVGTLPPETAADLIVTAAHAREAAQIPCVPQATLPAHVETMLRHRRHVRPEMVERQRKIG